VNTQTDVIDASLKHANTSTHARILSEDEASSYFQFCDPGENYISDGNVVMQGRHTIVPFELTAIGASGQYLLTTHA